MANRNQEFIEIEVVCALPRVQTVVALKVAAGTTVREALAQSGMVMVADERDAPPVGIFGKRVTLATVLHPDDRVEIYRLLIADPKQARRRRARSPNAPRRIPADC